MAHVPVLLKLTSLKTAYSREVASFHMTFDQKIDKEGQVADLPRGGLINLKLKALNSGQNELLHWMAEKNLTLGGEITFYNTTNGHIMKNLIFSDAYCVHYEEHWEDDTKSIPLAHWEDITISCRKITNGVVQFENFWDFFKDDVEFKRDYKNFSTKNYDKPELETDAYGKDHVHADRYF